MITSTIEIRELPNGMLTVEMTPDMKDTSEREDFAYGLIVRCVHAGLERLAVELGGRAESIVGTTSTPQAVFDAARARAENHKRKEDRE